MNDAITGTEIVIDGGTVRQSEGRVIRVTSIVS